MQNIGSCDRSPEVMPTASMATYRRSTTAFKDVEPLLISVSPSQFIYFQLEIP